ncbi:MAG: hypothetical protein RDV41_14370, partial [Planctomycetota bacterium]|nr:hypothetical protein [Planctomycetota bacterium]
EFRKLIDHETQKKIEKEQAIQLVKDFLVREGLVRLGKGEAFGPVRVCSLQRDRETEEDLPGEQSVLLQSVKLGREFAGKPVVNSMISVYFHPDNREVLGIKHWNWTSVSTKEAPERLTPIKRQKEVESAVTRRMQGACAKLERAEVTRVTRAWFQTEDELIPVLAFEVEIKRTDEKGNTSPRYHTEYVNLVGDDEALRPAGR